MRIVCKLNQSDIVNLVAAIYKAELTRLTAAGADESVCLDFVVREANKLRSIVEGNGGCDCVRCEAKNQGVKEVVE